MFCKSWKKTSYLKNFHTLYILTEILFFSSFCYKASTKQFWSTSTYSNRFYYLSDGSTGAQITTWYVKTLLHQRIPKGTTMEGAFDSIRLNHSTWRKAGGWTNSTFRKCSSRGLAQTWNAPTPGSLQCTSELQTHQGMRQCCKLQAPESWELD